MIKIIKVTGESLSPFFLHGDFVLVLNFPWIFNQIHIKDIIVFDHPEYGILIKKVVAVDPRNESITVAGTEPNSITSKAIGPIQKEDMIGKVIFHIKKPRH